MRDQPKDLDERELREALRHGWGIEPDSLRYVAVGFGDHHWIAGDWFVTVSENDVRQAMDTAAALPLDFVVAPIEPTARRVGRYTVSVFPLIDGESGEFGRPQPAEVADLLAELHRTAPPPSTPPPSPGLPAPDLDTREPWRGGPYSEPARALVAEHARSLRDRLAEFKRRLGELVRKEPALVVTHGEPHPGNLLRAGGRYLLVDWDTVRLAVPERDLWWPGADLDRYEDARGHRPDPSALALYALRWDLADLGEFVTWFRGPHEAGADTETAWNGLTELVKRLTAPS